MPDGGWSKLLVDSWTAGHFFFNALCGCWASKLPVSLSYWNPEKWCRQPWNIVKDVWNLGENIAAYKNVYLWAVTTIVLSCFVGKINFVFFFQIYIGMLNYLLFAFTQGIVAADGGVWIRCFSFSLDHILSKANSEVSVITFTQPHYREV